MAGRGNPSFLKNQKAKMRTERASLKRAARQARRTEKADRAAAKTPIDGTTPVDDGTEEPGESTPAQ